MLESQNGSLPCSGYDLMVNGLLLKIEACIFIQLLATTYNLSRLNDENLLDFNSKDQQHCIILFLENSLHPFVWFSWHKLSQITIKNSQHDTNAGSAS